MDMNNENLNKLIVNDLEINISNYADLAKASAVILNETDQMLKESMIKINQKMTNEKNSMDELRENLNNINNQEMADYFLNKISKYTEEVEFEAQKEIVKCIKDIGDLRNDLDQDLKETIKTLDSINASKIKESVNTLIQITKLNDPNIMSAAIETADFSTLKDKINYEIINLSEKEKGKLGLIGENDFNSLINKLKKAEKEKDKSDILKQISTLSKTRISFVSRAISGLKFIREKTITPLAKAFKEIDLGKKKELYEKGHDNTELANNIKEKIFTAGKKIFTFVKDTGIKISTPFVIYANDVIKEMKCGILQHKRLHNIKQIDKNIEKINSLETKMENLSLKREKIINKHIEKASKILQISATPADYTCPDIDKQISELRAKALDLKKETFIYAKENIEYNKEQMELIESMSPKEKAIHIKEMLEEGNINLNLANQIDFTSEDNIEEQIAIFEKDIDIQINQINNDINDLKSISDNHKIVPASEYAQKQTININKSVANQMYETPISKEGKVLPAYRVIISGETIKPANLGIDPDYTRKNGDRVYVTHDPKEAAIISREYQNRGGKITLDASSKEAADQYKEIYNNQKQFESLNQKAGIKRETDDFER